MQHREGAADAEHAANKVSHHNVPYGALHSDPIIKEQNPYRTRSPFVMRIRYAYAAPVFGTSARFGLAALADLTKFAK
jgi:hypothetical protein